MKICIPITEDNGLGSQVNSHFGSAPDFLIYDEEGNSFEVIHNADAHHSHGMCHPLSQLTGKDINVIICSGMGVRAVQRLNEGGIKAFRTRVGKVTAGEILNEFKHGGLVEITADTACHDHHC